jgi:putative SOS response-associated peptidase YedK
VAGKAKHRFEGCWYGIRRGQERRAGAKGFRRSSQSRRDGGHSRCGKSSGFEGLWERWTSPDGITLESCTVITTGANELVLPVHDRMPVILDPSRYSDWLDPKNVDTGLLLPLLSPWPAGEMAAAPANPVVNNARKEGPACLST